MPRTGLTIGEVRDRAISSAEERIRKIGVEKMRLVDVAQDLGISHAALYKRFPDRASLIDAVSERWLLGVDGSLDAVVKGCESIEERLQLWFRKFHALKRDKVINDPEAYKAFDMASHSMRPFVRSHMETVTRQVTELVQEAMECGVIRNGDPLQTAVLLFELTIAFHHPTLVAERAAENREPMLNEVLETALAGLKP